MVITALRAALRGRSSALKAAWYYFMLADEALFDDYKNEAETKESQPHFIFCDAAVGVRAAELS
ncbi:hypothetical protein ACVR0O_00425 [Streptococcus caviae]|uniref:hypothetical protein n=1 Tax=Streptococcus sp. 'caviae' TaxID=1915004 RepID=UPI00214C297F|nr:hypothetical protein [Streptococcus sp. 'caviae']